MRLYGLIFLIGALTAAQLGVAQSYPELQAVVQEVDLSKSVHIFPNPATEDVYVELERFPAANVIVTVHTIIGNELPVEKEIMDENVIRVRVKDLASGYYLLAIKDEESKFRGTYKFLKR